MHKVLQLFHFSSFCVAIPSRFSLANDVQACKRHFSNVKIILRGCSLETGVFLVWHLKMTSDFYCPEKNSPSNQRKSVWGVGTVDGESRALGKSLSNPLADD